MMDDEQLLHAYARERSESAFGELVARHIDFVYSTALRVVNGDSHLAQDVAQTVFIDLARKAGSLPDDVALPGWLHRHTCYTATKAVRTERRRQSREQTAMEMRALDDNTRPEWEQVVPYLDESLNQLNPADRDALVLRFLKQQDLRTVGVALGISDDAAQKRVDRALEKLHVLLKHRGATLSAAALGTALATEAVTAAPAGLAATVTAAALSGTAITTTAVIAATKAIAMTTLQKTVITAALAVALGTGIYEARQAANTRKEMQTLQQRQTEQLEQVQRDADERARQLTALRDENQRLTRDTSDLLRLRRDIGELRSQAKTYEELRKENSQLRNSLDKAGQAQQTPTNNYPTWWREKAPMVASILTKSVLAYAAQNHGQLPKNISEASGLFKDAIQPDPVLQDESALAESAKLFEAVFQGSNEGLTNGGNVILIRETVPQQRPDGMYERAYGFADGHAEVWVNPDGNYSDKEAKRPTYNDTNTTNRLERVITR
jgi:RNA polymerase sigma factor (sigma-70 family)